LLLKYESKKYKEKFAWVDNVATVRDRALVEQLDQLLIGNITKRTPHVWLAVPEVLNWEEISGFAYKMRKHPAVSPDIHLAGWLNDVVEEDAEDAVDIELLKRKRIIAYDINYELYKHWPVYHCLNAEIDLRGVKYILNDGSWYAIDVGFVTTVNTFFDSIKESKVSLPPSGFMKEPEYNQFVAAKHSDRFCLMDRKLIEIGNGRNTVEFCDLFSRTKQLIHVKKYGGSSVLSHLFQQGIVSGELFLSESSFRTEVNELLDKDFRLPNPAEHQKAAEYEICYAIMSDVPGPLHIPFFSKVVLKNAVKRLTAYGYRVTKKKIEQN
jgi:uncharacterized protein (TIGR04141 family)